MRFDLEKQEDRHEAHHVSRLFEVETVSEGSPPHYTPLKRGVNESRLCVQLAYEISGLGRRSPEGKTNIC